MIIMPVVKSLRALKAPAHTSIHLYSIPQADVKLMTGAHLVPWLRAVPTLTSTLHPPPPSPGLISGWTYVIQHNDGCHLSYLFSIYHLFNKAVAAMRIAIVYLASIVSPWLRYGRGGEFSNESCWKLPATDPLNKTSLEDKFQVKGWRL